MGDALPTVSAPASSSIIMMSRCMGESLSRRDIFVHSTEVNEGNEDFSPLSIVTESVLLTSPAFL